MKNSPLFNRRQFSGAALALGAATASVRTAEAAEAAQQATPSAARRGPPVPDLPARQFSKHVWGVIARESMPTEDDLGLFTNSYFVITRKGVVMYDTGGSVQIGEMLVRQVKAVTSKPVVAVINSHWHGDHWMGNQAFAEAFGKDLPIYAMKGCREGVSGEVGKTWESNLFKWTNGATAGTRAVIPNRDIAHGDVLDFGDVKLRAHSYGQCHTPYDLSIEVVEDKVTIVGDMATNRRISNMEDGSFEGAIQHMEKIMAATKTKLWLSGHGEPNEDLVRWNKTLFEGIWESALEAVKDDSGPLKAKELALVHPKVLAARPGTIGFNANIGKFCSIAYLEAEKKA